MINLLPPNAKQAKLYGQHNAQMLRYVWLLVFVAIGLGVMFAGTEVYMARQRADFGKQISAKQQQIDTYQSLQAQAKTANAQLKAFTQLVSGQTRFSALLADLASHTPKGVFVNSISFTGTATAVQIAATANSYQSAASFRDALVTSPRVKQADIESVSNSSAGVYNISVTVAFKPGAFQ